MIPGKHEPLYLENRCASTVGLAFAQFEDLLSFTDLIAAQLHGVSEANRWSIARAGEEPGPVLLVQGHGPGHQGAKDAADSKCGEDEMAGMNQEHCSERDSDRLGAE